MDAKIKGGRMFMFSKVSKKIKNASTYPKKISIYEKFFANFTQRLLFRFPALPSAFKETLFLFRFFSSIEAMAASCLAFCNVRMVSSNFLNRASCSFFLHVCEIIHLFAHVIRNLRADLRTQFAGILIYGVLYDIRKYRLKLCHFIATKFFFTIFF